MTSYDCNAVDNARPSVIAYLSVWQHKNYLCVCGDAVGRQLSALSTSHIELQHILLHIRYNTL